MLCFRRVLIPIVIGEDSSNRVEEALTVEQDEDSAIEHEKVRFGRKDRASLGRMPSAVAPAPLRTPGTLRRRLWRSIAGLVFLLLFVTCAALVAVYFVGVDAIGNARLRQQAALVLTRMAGEPINVHLGQLNVDLGTTSLFALEVKDATINRASDGAPLARANQLSFGIRAIPLFWGRLELSQVAMQDAELSASTMLPFFQGAQRPTAISADALKAAVFAGVRSLYYSAESAGLSRLTLNNVSLVDEGGDHLVQLENLELRLSSATKLNMEGAVNLAGYPVRFGAAAERQSDDGPIKGLSVDLAVDGTQKQGNAIPALERLGSIKASLEGNETDPKGSWLHLQTEIADLKFRAQNDEVDIARANLHVSMRGAEKSFAIGDSSIAMGRSVVNLQGEVVPDAENEESYAFTILLPQSRVAPVDSPEQPLQFIARSSGKFDLSRMEIAADRIDLRTPNGGASAWAAVTFSPGKAPGITLELDVAEIPTAEAKQLWPWFSAPGARRWVMDNLFGGTVRDSSLRLMIPPGRLGNGVPLSGEEVSGQFNVKGTRFDLVGELPPVRESDGWVEFEGTDVFVGLTNGVAYLPSGRVVRTGGGTMELKAAHKRPRIGKLAIDVSGEAAAVAEFASLKPINASFLDLKPDDFSGQVSGHIGADIPLHEGIPAETLDWNVELAYENLALGKPVEGQEIKAATGTMLLSRSRAQFSADAELNGVPAKLELLEPLGKSKTDRQRNIELEVTDSQRERLFPGLGTLVSGRMLVKYEQGSSRDRRISVDLGKSQLSVPWIGWQKGSGIPARASFILREKDGQTELADFKLEGESFSLTGNIVLAKGRLQQAQFRQVRFNREDELAATIKAKGSGYDVTVTGNSFDARPVIKLVTGKEAKTTQSGQSDPITVTAKLNYLTGFHGVKLEKAVVEYSSGNGPDKLSIRAATPGYGSVAFDRWTEGGQRRLQLTSENGGEVLRFLDFYRYMHGGRLNLGLVGPNDNALRGRVTIDDFLVINEPRLGSLVAASSKSGKSDKVDVTRVQFGTAFADLAKGDQRIDIANGIIRGPSIGFAFQGTLFDKENNTNMTGTFMPAYGLNRIFGEIPLIGQILGNGRDRGLIGITFKVVGPFDQPRLELNPISAIAPGIFRQIFEYN